MGRVVTARSQPPVRLDKKPVNPETLATLAHRTHRRRVAGYTDVPVPISYLERLIRLASRVVKNEN